MALAACAPLAADRLSAEARERARERRDIDVVCGDEEDERGSNRAR